MKETEIKTFAEFHNLIETYDTRTVIYRGVKAVPASREYSAVTE